MIKAVIFDASTLISLSMSSLLYVLEKLKKPDLKFIITHSVKKEAIDRPLKSKKYKLGALQIKKLYDEKTIELPESLGINQGQIQKQTKKLLKIANHTFFAEEKWLDPIDEGEISCLAVAEIIGKKNSVVAMDERSTRMLCEKPENLRKLFEKKLHTRVKSKKQNYKFFQDFKIIRSSEIVYTAYKKGIIKLKNHDVLDALLYGTKFKGAAISYEEIEDIKKIK